MKRLIPNIITLMNLFSGCLAIYFALVEKDAVVALWLIIAAGVFDLFDGMVARLLNAQSSIGADLDSLSDVVSFGVAPSFLVFEVLRDLQLEGSFWIALPAFLIALFAAYRLAKFNNDTRQTDGFIGLPVPANALFWIGIVGTIPCCVHQISPILLVGVIYLLILLVGWAMVSEVALIGFKVHFPIASAEDRMRLVFALLLLLSAALFGWLLGWGGISIVIIEYFIGSLIMNFRQTKR